MRSKLLHLLKRWWFWLWVVLLCAVPAGEWMGATGDHYNYGVPFPSLYVKHGNMGIGGHTQRGLFLFPRWITASTERSTNRLVHPPRADWHRIECCSFAF